MEVTKIRFDTSLSVKNRGTALALPFIGLWLAVSSAIGLAFPEEKPAREVPGYEWKPVGRDTWDKMPFYARMRLEKQAKIGDSVVWLPVRNDVEIGKLQADQIRQLGETNPSIRYSHIADRFETATKLAASRDPKEKRRGERDKEEILAELYSRVGPLALKAAIAGKKPTAATLDFSSLSKGSERPLIVDMDKVTGARDVYQALSDIEKDKSILPLLRMQVVDMVKSLLDRKVTSAKGNPDRTPGVQTKKWLGKVHEVLKALTKAFNERATEAAKSDSASAAQALALKNGGHVDVKEAPNKRAQDLRTGAQDLVDAALSHLQDQVDQGDQKTDLDLASAEAFVNEVLGPNREIIFDGLAKLVGLRREMEKGKKSYKESYEKLAKELKEKFKFDLDEFCSVKPLCPGAAVACRK